MARRSSPQLSEVDDSRLPRWGKWFIGLVEICGIHKLSCAVAKASSTAVNVTEDVNPRLLHLDSSEKLFTTQMCSIRCRLIENSIGRPMRNQHVEFIRNSVPVFLCPIATWIHECPREKLRGVGRSPE